MLPEPIAKSRYLFPSTSSTTAPSTFFVKIGYTLSMEGWCILLSSLSMSFLASGPGGGVIIFESPMATSLAQYADGAFKFLSPAGRRRIRCR